MVMPADHPTARAANRGPLRAGPMLLLAVWVGLLVGVVEGIYEVLRHWVVREPHWAYGYEVLWMAPLASVAIYGTLGGLLALVAGRWPRAGSVAVSGFLFSLLSGVILLSVIIPGLHAIAVVLLAAGSASQVARWTSRRGGPLLRQARRSTPWIAGAVVAVGLGLHALGWLAERNGRGEFPAADSGAPNVLLLMLDTVRAQSLSLYGYARSTTPQLERIAQTATVFDRAFAPAPWTLPSQASIFTGRLPRELSADWRRPLDDAFPTIAETLRQKGYATAGFVANLYYCSAQFGLDRGFTHYEDHPLSVGMIVQRSWLVRGIRRKLTGMLGSHKLLARKDAARLTDDFLAWLPKRDDRPFFAFLNYYDAHEPYLPPPPFRWRFGAKNSLYWLREPAYRYSNKEIQELKDAYDSAIAYLDDQLGRLFRELDERNILDNTVVIITSDHGEEFAEHDVVDHGNSLYVPSLHVPLLIRFPARVPSGQRIGHPVSLRQLPATIVEILDLDDTAIFPGASLVSPEGSNNAASGFPVASEVNVKPWGIPSWFPLYHGPMQSLISDSIHYIRDGAHRERLYNINADPWEQVDLRHAEGSQETVERMRALLDRGLGQFKGAVRDPAARAATARP